MSTEASAAVAPSADTPLEHTHEGFGWALGVLLRAYHATVGPILDDLPHGHRGYETLATVVHGDQPNQVALATYLGIDRTVMTYLIDDLVEAGLVERQPHPDDRRQRKIVATPRGRQALARCRRRVEHAEDHLLVGLDDEQRGAFKDMLRAVACAVRDIDPDTDPCDVATDVLTKGGSAPHKPTPDS